MTMIKVDDVAVVLEGNRRLRWERPSGLSGRPPAPAGDPLRLRVWPDVSAGAELRLWIRTCGRTVVVFEGGERPMPVPGNRVLGLPPEVVEHTDLARLEGRRDRLLSVTPLTWLPAEHLARGTAFLADARAIDGRIHHAAPGPIIVEDDLIGTTAAMRFVYSRRPLGLGEFRDIIARIFERCAGGETRAGTRLRAEPLRRAA